MGLEAITRRLALASRSNREIIAAYVIAEQSVRKREVYDPLVVERPSLAEFTAKISEIHSDPIARYRQVCSPGLKYRTMSAFVHVASSLTQNEDLREFSAFFDKTKTLFSLYQARQPVVETFYLNIARAIKTIAQEQDTNPLLIIGSQEVRDEALRRVFAKREDAKGFLDLCMASEEYVLGFLKDTRRWVQESRLVSSARYNEVKGMLISDADAEAFRKAQAAQNARELDRIYRYDDAVPPNVAYLQPYRFDDATGEIVSGSWKPAE